MCNNNCWNDNNLNLLNKWFERSEICRNAHRVEVKKYMRLHNVLGLFLCTTSTALGTALYFELTEKFDLKWENLALGAITMILSYLHTYLNHNEKARIHDAIRAGFAALAREIDLVLQCPPQNEDECRRTLRKIKTTYDELAGNNVYVSERVWKSVKKEYTKIAQQAN